MGFDMDTAVLPKERRQVTDQDRLNIVTHLAEGKTILQVADVLDLHRTQVESVGSMYGHPQLHRLERSRVALAGALEVKPKVAPAPPAPVPVARTRSQATQDRVDYQEGVLERTGATRAQVAAWANARTWSVGRSGLIARDILDAFEASRG